MINTPPTPIDVSNGMSLDDFMRLSNDHPFEIINGRRIDKMASGQLHSEIIQKIFILLYLYITQFQLGRVYQETIFILPEKKEGNWVSGSRIPDIMFYESRRIEAYNQANTDNTKPIALIPDFIIEVLSPTDLFFDVEDKIFADFDNGVRVIWLIDPIHKRASIYTADSTIIQRFHLTGHLTALDILPNFALDLSQIWA